MHAAWSNAPHLWPYRLDQDTAFLHPSASSRPPSRIPRLPPSVRRPGHHHHRLPLRLQWSARLRLRLRLRRPPARREGQVSVAVVRGPRPRAPIGRSRPEERGGGDWRGRSRPEGRGGNWRQEHKAEEADGCRPAGRGDLRYYRSGQGRRADRAGGRAGGRAG